ALSRIRHFPVAVNPAVPVSELAVGEPPVEPVAGGVPFRVVRALEDPGPVAPKIGYALAIIEAKPLHLDCRWLEAQLFQPRFLYFIPTRFQLLPGVRLRIRHRPLLQSDQVPFVIERG